MRRPFFLLAPGAGAPCSHPWIRGWKQRLEELGRVSAFDYDYMQAGRRRPDPLPQLVDAHRRALAANRGANEDVFLIGKSMGGRIGCHLSIQEPVTGVICLSYPLCGGGDRAKLRDQVLRELTTPVLFIQGTRDPLCPLDLLEQIQTEMKTPNRLHRVEGGDHSLLVRKGDLARFGKSQEDVNKQILEEIAAFVEQASAGGGPLANGRHD